MRRFLLAFAILTAPSYAGAQAEVRENAVFGWDCEQDIAGMPAETAWRNRLDCLLARFERVLKSDALSGYDRQALNLTIHARRRVLMTRAGEFQHAVNEVRSALSSREDSLVHFTTAIERLAEEANARDPLTVEEIEALTDALSIYQTIFACSLFGNHVRAQLHDEVRVDGELLSAPRDDDRVPEINGVFAFDVWSVTPATDEVEAWLPPVAL